MTLKASFVACIVALCYALVLCSLTVKVAAFKGSRSFIYLPPTFNHLNHHLTIRNSYVQNAVLSTSLQAWNPKKNFNIDLNNFFREPVPADLQKIVEISSGAAKTAIDGFIYDYIVAPPGNPGVPRPLWLVILGSLPTGFLWYGYYKFAVEEELMNIEISKGKDPRGFGGYGTLGPFTYCLTLGTAGQILHIPGSALFSLAGIIFIYYTQFLLYDRVNELYKEEGLEPPLQVWWCLPIFFPFNLIVGLRQVHFLSQYFYRQSSVNPPPRDPVANFFPFISSPKFTWKEFFKNPSLWCSLLNDIDEIPSYKLPKPLRALIEFDDSKQSAR